VACGDHDCIHGDGCTQDALLDSVPEWILLVLAARYYDAPAALVELVGDSQRVHKDGLHIGHDFIHFEHLETFACDLLLIDFFVAWHLKIISFSRIFWES